MHLVGKRALTSVIQFSGPSGICPHDRRNCGRLMADAKSNVAFARAAVSFEVHESDFLVLAADRVSTFESMAYRFPQAGDLEDYLKKIVRVKNAYRDSHGAVITFPKPSPMAWDDFKMEEDVGCVRKLWNLSIQVSKRQMERMAGEDPDVKSKVTLTTAQELEDKAVATGMPAPVSDRDRPSLHTLTRVQAAFGPGGTFQHLPWEAYVNMEQESKLRRAGKMPKDKKELVVENKRISLASGTEAELPETQHVDSVLALQDVLDLRARAYHMLEVSKFHIVMAYSDKLMGYLRASTPDGMRSPTLNEARRADREIMEEILKWIAKGKGSVHAGLNHYSSRQDESLWKLVMPQPEGMPDQGREKHHRSSTASVETDKGKKRKAGEDEETERGKGDALPPRMCIVCKRRHEPRCTIPAGFRKEEKEKKKLMKAKAKQAPGKSREDK